MTCPLGEGIGRGGEESSEGGREGVTEGGREGTKAFKDDEVCC